MTNRELDLLHRLRQATQIPLMAMGGGTQSASLSGHIAYAKDAATALAIWQEGSLALCVGSEWQGWTHGSANDVIAAAERWRERRNAQDWCNEGAKVLTMSEMLGESS